MPTPRSSREFEPSSTALADLVPKILQQVDGAREARQGNCVRLLERLAPHLQEVKEFEREYERQWAPRFNTFNYLRDDELGLSEIIADLLNPCAEHGQGTSFLEAMLDVFPETGGWFDKLYPEADSSIRVERERWIPGGGRIDITVDMPSVTGCSCLAFENKPYASYNAAQIEAYLGYLQKEYGTRFLLVYLPPKHYAPDDERLTDDEREIRREHFRIMPYIGEGTSLQKWFAACQRVCEAQRVSWFLKDAQTFCQQQFGKTSMSDNPDVRFVQKYLSENPNQLSAALAIHDAWIPARDEVCERFLKHLCKTVEVRVREEIAPDCNVWFHYEGEKRSLNRLWITRDDWVMYDDLPRRWIGRSQIMLESSGPGPNKWAWGVRNPKPLSKMSEKERERREKLSSALTSHRLRLSHDSDWWPQWEWLSRYYRNWNPIVPELAEEYNNGGGEITDYYVDGLLEIARCAIPAINEVETVKRESSE